MSRPSRRKLSRGVVAVAAAFAPTFCVATAPPWNEPARIAMNMNAALLDEPAGGPPAFAWRRAPWLQSALAPAAMATPAARAPRMAPGAHLARLMAGGQLASWAALHMHEKFAAGAQAASWAWVDARATFGASAQAASWAWVDARAKFGADAQAASWASARLQAQIAPDTRRLLLDGSAVAAAGLRQPWVAAGRPLTARPAAVFSFSLSGISAAGAAVRDWGARLRQWAWTPLQTAWRDARREAGPRTAPRAAPRRVVAGRPAPARFSAAPAPAVRKPANVVAANAFVIPPALPMPVRTAVTVERSSWSRDPFAAPVASQQVSAAPEQRPPGLPGLDIDDVDIQAIALGGVGGPVALAEGPDKQTYFLHAGSQLYRAQVVRIEGDGVVFERAADSSDPHAQVLRRVGQGAAGKAGAR